MATLTGKTIANTYKDLLQVSNNNGGVDGTLRTVSDGEGTNSPLQLSNSAVNINGTFQLNGNTLTATASALNAVTDLSGVTGLVAMTGGTPLGRSIAVGTGLSVTNADGVAGNPTVELDSTAVVAGSYGPVSNFAVNAKGQVVSASTPVSVSIATVRTSELVADNVLVSSNVSVKGDVLVSGGLEVLGDVSSNHLYATSINVSVLNATEITVSILNLVNVSVSTLAANQLVVTQKASVSSLNVVGKVSGTNAVFSGNVSASAFYGDGSNLTNLPTAPVSVSAYTVNILTVVSAATVNGIISATNFVGGGAGLTNVSAIFASSATNATNAVNATSAVFASSATNATNAVSAVFATSATNATNAVNATNATSAVFATSATNATNAVNATNATSAVFAASATNATNAVNATSAVFATSATNATNAVNATNATSAVFAASATNATTAVNVAGGGTVNAASGSFTGIVSVNEINASIGNFIGAVSVGGALNVVGAVSGTNAVFSGTVSANIVDASVAEFNGRVSIGGALNVTGAVSGTSAIFTGNVSVSAAIVAGAGTVGAPSYSTTGDTNTGLYFPAADTIAVATSGTERMRIDNAGNVGIATTSPSSFGKFAVQGNLSTRVFYVDSLARPVARYDNNAYNDGLTIRNSGILAADQGTGLLFQLGTGGTAVDSGAIQMRSEADYSTAANRDAAMAFFTAANGTNSERMRIDSSGNVGIGTSSPLKQLEITKSARAVITSLTDSTSISVDFNTAQNFAVMLTGNRTLENPTNCVAGQTGSIFVMQNVSGGKTLSFGSNWKFAAAAAPTLTTTASAVDRIDYIVFTSTAIQAVATLDVR